MAASPRVLVYPADEGGCGFYRLIWPTVALTEQGADVQMVLPNDPVGWQVCGQFWTDDRGRSELLDVVLPEADVVVLQRPLQDLYALAIPMLQAKGIKVVVEIDDDFDAISRRNVSWKFAQPSYSATVNRNHLRRACELADLVTVTTPALARRYAPHGRVAIIPNHVPKRYLDVPRPGPRDDVWVGWSGSVETHPDDLQVCGSGVADAITATGARFGVVGTGKGVRQRLGLKDPVAAVGWVPIDRYPEAMAQFDVGIVPLEPSAFNEAKSALKMLEFAAVGVPAVVSPTTDNLRMIEQGIGMVADKPRAWKGQVSALVRDEARRLEMAERGRQVAARWTIEGNCDRWWDAWTSVVNSPVKAGVRGSN